MSQTRSFQGIQDQAIRRHRRALGDIVRHGEVLIGSAEGNIQPDYRTLDFADQNGVHHHTSNAIPTAGIKLIDIDLTFGSAIVGQNRMRFSIWWYKAGQTASFKPGTCDSFQMTRLNAATHRGTARVGVAYVISEPMDYTVRIFALPSGGSNPA